MKRPTPAVRAAVLLMGLLTCRPSEAADLGFRGFELRAGMVEPDLGDSTYGFGAAVDLGELHDGLRLYPSVFYYSTEIDPLLFLPIEIDVLALGAEVRYWLNEGSTSGWYFGGGPYIYDVSLSDASASLGISSSGVIGVAGFSFGPALKAEARYATGLSHISVCAALSLGGD